MPQVTPHNTNHLRKNATFRGTRTEPFAVPPAVEKANRRRKRRLLNDAVRLAGNPNLLAAGRGLVAVKHRWARIGSAGAEHETELERRLERVLADFRARYAQTTPKIFNDTDQTPDETDRRTTR